MRLPLAGYATFATRILPQWTGWLAYAATVLCVMSIVFGTLIG